MPTVSPSVSPIIGKPQMIPPDTIAWASKPRKPTDLSIPAIIVTLFFNHVVGLFAFHFSVSAKYSWQLHDYKRSKKHSKYAVIFIIVGIIVGIATYALALSLYFTLNDNNSCLSNSLNNTQTERTTDCCWYTTTNINEPNETNQEARVVGEDLYVEPQRSLYCTSTSSGLINPDPNGKYQDCCFEFQCFPLNGF